MEKWIEDNGEWLSAVIGTTTGVVVFVVIPVVTVTCIYRLLF